MKKMLKFLNKIFRFFFPKNFNEELRRGMQIGSESKAREIIGTGLFNGGKQLRKIVDPQHKLKIGSQKEKK